MGEFVHPLMGDTLVQNLETPVLQHAEVDEILVGGAQFSDERTIETI
jgi:hypothetical protein